jgi:PIN domain nuclease of toxin-antitoxin system
MPDPLPVLAELRERGLLDGAVSIEPFGLADVVEVARLRSLTKDAGPSLADRACLALARRLASGAVASDRAWLTMDGLGVIVELVRGA